MNYLMIQNPGVAPTEAYTLLGASTTKDSSAEGVIGQFGSGGKHAINVLLRAGLKLRIYCGKTRLEFGTRDDVLNDGLTKKPIKRVVVKFGGTSTKTMDLGWVLDFGAVDWSERIDMALREFVSNALDRTIREEGGFLAAKNEGRLAVEIRAGEPKAKAGHTRVFVEANDAVIRYFGELPRRLLHFSDHPEEVKMGLLPKRDRNLTGGSAMIYREGVLVREMPEHDKPSVYDYNFRRHELDIDESRNSSAYAVKAACARNMRRANAQELEQVFKSLTAGEDTFETGLDPDYMCSSWDDPSDGEKENWKTAWEAVAGDGVWTLPSATDYVQRKGKVATPVKALGWYTAANRFGLVTDTNVLTDSEQRGREVFYPTEDAIKAVDEVWSWIEAAGMVGERKKPPVKCFRERTDGESDTMGYYDHAEGVVHIREDIASEGVSKFLLKVALDELTHHMTGSGDSSRDFQNFLTSMIVEIAAAPVA